MEENGKIIRVGHVEIRLDDDGEIDEIVTYDNTGQCNFHLERMTDDNFWMRWYSTPEKPLGKELVVHFQADLVETEEDDVKSWRTVITPRFDLE